MILSYFSNRFEDFQFQVLSKHASVEIDMKNIVGLEDDPSFWGGDYFCLSELRNTALLKSQNNKCLEIS